VKRSPERESDPGKLKSDSVIIGGEETAEG